MKTTHPMLYLVMLLLAIAPFFGGLYLWDSQLAFLFFASLALTIFLVWPRRTKTAHVLLPIDYAVFGLTALYLLATVWAVTPRLALQVGLKQLLYCEVYWLVSRSLVSLSDRTRWGRILAGLSVLVAVSSIVMAAGWIPYAGAVSFNRISGPFQYPNTLASLLLFGIGLLLSMRGQADGLKERLRYGGSLFLVVSVFVFTYSRIAWLMAPLVVCLVVLLMPKGKRVSTVMGLLAVLLASGLIFIPVDQALRQNALILLPLWFLGGLAASLGLEFLNYLTRDRDRMQVGVLALLGVGTLATVTLALPKAMFLIQRVSSFSTGEDSYLTRYWTYRDALRAWLSISPILGLGGSGWYSVYRAYRTVDIVSRLVHSSLIETLTELGVLGGLLLLSVWGLSLRGAWRARFTSETPSDSAVWAGVVAGLFGLLAHTLFDFDLWYGAFSMFLFAILGYIRSSSPTTVARDRKTRGMSPVRKLAAPAFTTLVAILAGVLWYATTIHATGMAYLQAQQYDKAMATLRSAVSVVPFDAEYQASLGDFLVQYGQITKNDALFVEGGQHLQSSIKYDRFNVDYHILSADYLQRAGKAKESLDELALAVNYDRLTVSTYQQSLSQGVSLAVEALANKSPDARGFVDQVGLILSQLDEARGKQPQSVPAGWLLNVNDPLVQTLRGAYMALTGHSADALPLLLPQTTSSDTTVARESLVWTAAVYRVMGKLPEAERAELQLKLVDDQAATRLPAIVQALTARK